MATTPLDAARDLVPSVAANADKAGVAGATGLPPETVAALVDAELHGVLTPRELGGSELPILDAIEVFAEISRGDGSAGWCLMASATVCAFFGSYGGDEFVGEMFADGVPLAAGRFAPDGIAVPDGDGYRISGRFQFGSGIEQARWVGAGVTTAPPEGSGAQPEYRFAVVPAERARVLGNWDVLGLEATASYDYELEDVPVPSGATFLFAAPTRRRGGPLYELGVIPLTAAGHAGFAIGVGRRALDELVAIAGTKQRLGAAVPLHESERFLERLGRLESRFRSARAWVREAFGRAEARVRESGRAELGEVHALRQATVHVTQEAADLTREAYLLAGTTALRAGPLQRCFRDLHAGSQHFFASPAATLDFARTLTHPTP